MSIPSDHHTNVVRTRAAIPQRMYFPPSDRWSSFTDTGSDGAPGVGRGVIGEGEGAERMVETLAPSVVMATFSFSLMSAVTETEDSSSLARAAGDEEEAATRPAVARPTAAALAEAAAMMCELSSALSSAATAFWAFDRASSSKASAFCSSSVTDASSSTADVAAAATAGSASRMGSSTFEERAEGIRLC
jgi:hypothetical protein